MKQIYLAIHLPKMGEISQNSLKTFLEFIWFSRLSLQRCSGKVCGRKKSKKTERKGDAGNNGLLPNPASPTPLLKKKGGRKCRQKINNRKGAKLLLTSSSGVVNRLGK